VGLAKIIEEDERGTAWTSGHECGIASEIRRRRTAAATMAHVSIPLKGISVAAACEKPIIPTVVGSSRSNQRAVSAP